jgi:hypothetical protein
MGNFFLSGTLVGHRLCKRRESHQSGQSKEKATEQELCVKKRGK